MLAVWLCCGNLWWALSVLYISCVIFCYKHKLIGQPNDISLCVSLQHLMITARRFTVQIEEKLLLKLLNFFGYDQSESGTVVRPALPACKGNSKMLEFCQWDTVVVERVLIVQRPLAMPGLSLSCVSSFSLLKQSDFPCVCRSVFPEDVEQLCLGTTVHKTN